MSLEGHDESPESVAAKQRLERLLRELPSAVKDVLDTGALIDPTILKQSQILSKLIIGQSHTIGDNSQPAEADAALRNQERLPAPTITDWLPPHIIGPRWMRLNHLLSLVVLRDYLDSEQCAVSPTLIQTLQEGITYVATHAKTGMRHIPLPPRCAIEEQWTYEVKGLSYKDGAPQSASFPATLVTPGYHEGQELEDQAPGITSYDFVPEILETHFEPQNRVIRIERNRPMHPPYRPLQGFLFPQAKEVFRIDSPAQTGKGPRRGIQIYKLEERQYVIEITIRSNQYYTYSRGSWLRCLVLLRSSDETMQTFMEQLRQSHLSQTDESLLYYLTSTLYFQSDPDRPYLPGIIPSGFIHSNRPSGQLEYLPDPWRPTREKYYAAVRSRLREADGDALMAIQLVLNKDYPLIITSSPQLDVEPVKATLKRIFPNLRPLDEQLRAELEALSPQ